MSLGASIERIAPKGIVWDFDGVLCDSARLFRELIGEKLEARGLQKVGARVRSDTTLTGLDTKDLVAHLLGEVRGFDVSEFARELEEAYERVASGRLSIDTQAISIVRRARRRGVDQCIVSNGRPGLIRVQLAKSGVTEAFNCIVTPTQSLPPKPSPAMYQVAVNALGLDLSDCIVIEDSEIGVIGAGAAGLRVVTVALFP